MGLKDNIAKFLGLKSNVVTPMDPALIKENEIIKKQAQQIRTLQAQIGKLTAKEREEREIGKSKEKEKELIKKLVTQERELKSKEIGKSLSLRKFFYMLTINKNIRGKIELTDKEGKEPLGFFGDIAILEGDVLALLDIHNNIVCRGRQLSHIIYKPDAIDNYIKRKQIPIPFILGKDGDLNPILDIENLEYPNIVYNEKENLFEMTEEKQDKIKNLLISKDKDIRRSRGVIERLETLNMKLKEELDSFKRANALNENLAQNSQSALSTAMSGVMQIQTRFGDMQKEIVALNQQKYINETMIAKLEGIVEGLIEKATGLGVKTHFERSFSEVLDIIDQIRDKMPQQVIQNIESEKKEEVAVRPGQLLGQRQGNAQTFEQS